VTDETKPVEVPPTSEPSAPAEQPAEQPTAELEPAPQATTPNWLEELDKVDAKELRKNPKIAGIVGGEVQRAIQAERQRIQQEEGEKAARAAEQKLRDLAQSDPVQFAEQWLTEAQKTDVQRQLDNLHKTTRSDLAQKIGAAYRDIPEWKELTPDDFDKLARAVMGRPDDEALSIFSREATDLVAERRAERKVKERWEKEIAKEREAIRQEEAAKLLKNSEAPDGKPPKGAPANTNIRGMTDEQFTKWWNERYG
jgi:hypothetical protein